MVGHEETHRSSISFSALNTYTTGIVAVIRHPKRALNPFQSKRTSARFVNDDSGIPTFFPFFSATASIAFKA
jgi:hypothetical protein